MTEILLAGGVSLLVTAVSALWMIPALRRLKFGQSILEIGPNWHKSKQGTPTMGGFIFMTGITLTGVVAGGLAAPGGERRHLLLLILAWIYGLIGFTDDFAKIRKKQNKGLTALQKLLLQLAAAAAFLALLRYLGHLTTQETIPFTHITFTLPWVPYLICGILLVTGMDNAVNLTDGIDGLCAGVTLPVGVLFTILAWQRGQQDTAILGAALVGGMIGFLIFNFHPARVFMGDTGSLFLGGLLCGFAFILDIPLILILCGFVYILEMASVILQVGFFKLTHGKRLFKMAPIHHHFEMLGWSEVKVFSVFTALTSVLCAVAYIAVQ